MLHITSFQDLCRLFPQEFDLTKSNITEIDKFLEQIDALISGLKNEAEVRGFLKNEFSNFLKSNRGENRFKQARFLLFSYIQLGCYKKLSEVHEGQPKKFYRTQFDNNKKFFLSHSKMIAAYLSHEKFPLNYWAGKVFIQFLSFYEELGEQRSDELHALSSLLIKEKATLSPEDENRVLYARMAYEAALQATKSHEKPTHFSVLAVAAEAYAKELQKMKGDEQRIMTLFEEALESNARAGEFKAINVDDYCHANIAYFLGIQCGSQEKSQAILSLEKAIQHLELLSRDKTEDENNLLLELYGKLAQLMNDKSINEKALVLFEKIPMVRPYDYLICLNRQASFYFNDKDYLAALNLFEKATAFFEKNEQVIKKDVRFQNHVIFSLYHSKAVCFDELSIDGDKEKRIEVLKKALTCSMKIKDERKRAVFLFKIAICYDKLGRHQECASYATHALVCYRDRVPSEKKNIPGDYIGEMKKELDRLCQYNKPSLRTPTF